MTFRAILLFLFLLPILHAQDGGQLYTLYCSACHGADGKGATGGVFPPLAGSPWVAGEPDRAVKLVLKGIEGPIEVLGKTYNLAMPPQGAMLLDEQIAAILTFVRSSWGNQSPGVKPELVSTIRAATASRPTSWTAKELLTLHPLPLEKTALENLTSQVFPGDWDAIPDLSTLKAENIEEEHTGILKVSGNSHKDHFAILWQGGFMAPSDGEYHFFLDADDFAKLLIDGKPVSAIESTGPISGGREKIGKIPLTQGKHDFRLEYLEVSGKEGLILGWKKENEKNWRWLSETKGVEREVIMIEPTNGRPVIYRNFIKGTTPRGIAVGFPGGLSLAYSADNLAPELIWTGKFIDGAPRWLDRGTENAPPAGEKIINLTKTRHLPENARFRGYKLDANGNPTFAVQIENQFLLDSWKAETGVLIRKLSLSGDGNPLTVTLTESSLASLMLTSEGGAPLQTNNGQTQITVAPGKPVTLNYRWK